MLGSGHVARVVVAGRTLGAGRFRPATTGRLVQLVSADVAISRASAPTRDHALSAIC